VPAGFIPDLTALAEQDVTVRPLALLWIEILRTAAESAWEQSAAALERGSVTQGEPLLHRQTVPVDPHSARDLLMRLAASAAQARVPGADKVQHTVTHEAHLDVLMLLESGITFDHARREAIAADLGVSLPLLATLADLAVVPLLFACGRRATTLMPNIPWRHGFCPLCAAWPTLAELRGLERERWLRCGRCGAGWRFRHHCCVFCGNAAHESLGYLAPEADKESRRAVTCGQCRSYIKTFTTIAPLTPPEIVLRDLASLELDMAAIHENFGRPARPGFPLQISLIAAPGRRGWLPWR